MYTTHINSCSNIENYYCRAVPLH